MTGSEAPAHASGPEVGTTQRRLTLVAAMAGVSVAAIDQMVLATAVAAISGELGEIGHGPWLFTANLLMSSASMPIWGKLGDLYGRRPIFQGAVVLFVCASLFAARADSMLELIVCRAFQGLGGGALLTVPHAIVADVVTPVRRPAYLAMSSAVWAGAGLIGPPLGGFLVDGPGWRWMFILNLPTGLLAIVLMQVAYRAPRVRVSHRIDALGALLLVTAVGSLTLYTAWAGERFGFADVRALGLLALSIAAWLGFVLEERRAEEPIVHPGILTLPGVLPALLTTGLFGFANFAVAFLLPLYAITVNGASATQAGLVLMPLTVGLFLTGLLVGRRAATTGQYRRHAAGGLVIYIAGLFCLMTMHPGTPHAALWLYSLLLGIGSGPLTPIVVSSLQNAVPTRFLGVASSLPGFTRAVAQTIGTAALGAFLAVRLQLRLHSDAAPAAIAEAHRSALNETFLVMAALMGAALVASLFIHDHAGPRRR